MLQKKKTIAWRRGNGEMLGFAVCVPLFTLLMIIVMATSNYSTKLQQLTVASYAVGRAAVVSSTPDLATSRAYAVLQTIYGSDHCSTDESDTVNQAWFKIDRDGAWKTGQITTITVSQHIGGLFPFPEQDLHSSIAMMIEDDLEKVW